MRLHDFITRADQLIAQADEVLATNHKVDYMTYVDYGAFAGFRTSSLSFLNNLFDAQHPYYTDFDKRCAEAHPSDTSAGKAIIVAVREELKGGWLNTARGLLSAEIFADFLEMASYLLSEGYKDAAAVIDGSVLEEHLRQLCAKNSIAVTYPKGTDLVPKKADTLNADLAGANVYNKLDQKHVTAWLDLRNKAAHGKYGEYTRDQVQLMHQGIGDFMVRNAI